MNGRACRWTEQPEQDDALRLADSSVRRRRSAADTARVADPFAVTIAAPADLVGGRPEWCVDTGDRLLTMTTFELWNAIDRGEVPPWMRVWREGMECWTPVGELSEFAWALASTPLHQDLTPEVFADTPILGRGSPLPVVEDSSWITQPRIDRGGRWVALGSLVAAAAIGAATLSGMELSPAPMTPGTPLPAVTAGPESPAPAARPIPRDSDRTRPPARREERGQRRMSRDGRRSHGR